MTVCCVQTFKPNPYFEDTRLIKVFRFSDEGTISVNGTAPRWKDGMVCSMKENRNSIIAL